MIAELTVQAEFYTSLLGFFTVEVLAVMAAMYVIRRWPRS